MNTIKITFPQKSITAEQIMKSCDNKVAGDKLLYNTDWYKNEDFFTKEKTRQGTYEIDLEITHKCKTFSQASKNVSKSLPRGNEILNFAEYLYAIQESAEFRETISKGWIWTSSVKSNGRHLCVGLFGEGGLSVNRWIGFPSDFVGVGASRQVRDSKPGTLESVESLSLPEFLVINNIKYRKDE